MQPISPMIPARTDVPQHPSSTCAIISPASSSTLFAFTSSGRYSST